MSPRVFHFILRLAIVTIALTTVSAGISRAAIAPDYTGEDISLSHSLIASQGEVASSLGRVPGQRGIEHSGRGLLSGEGRLLRRMSGDVLLSAYRENDLEASADSAIADPGQASVGEWGATALVVGSISLFSGETRLLRRVGEEVMRNSYQNSGLRAKADDFLNDPGASGSAEWGAAALVGGTIALFSGIRAETKIAAAKLRLMTIPMLNMRRHYGSREFGRAEVSVGRMTVIAALRRHAGRFAASSLGLDYKLRY